MGDPHQTAAAPDPAAADPDAASRDRVLDAILLEVPFEGWGRGAVQRAAEALGLPVVEIDRLFPAGAAAMVAWHSERADRRMVEEIERRGLAAGPVRERIRGAVLIRLEQNAAHREAIRRSLAVLANPLAAPLPARLLYRTVDAIWHATGDVSTDFNFYTKRATLAAVYSATVLHWLDDRSEDFAATRAFLDRRLADVMRFEKLKASLRDFGARLARGPDLGRPRR